ncbi:MAG: hypothetical protein ACJAUQ_000446 [Maribacter sp.]|jgi:hypothetical protein
MKPRLISPIFIVVFLISCNTQNKSLEYQTSKKVDSVANELNNCGMLIESY